MAAVPNGHRLFNPSEVVNRAYERSLRRRIRVLDAWIRKLEERFSEASNRRSGGLMRIMDAIEQNNARRATLYARLQNHLQQQAAARNINGDNNINNNGGGAPPGPPAAGDAGN